MQFILVQACLRLSAGCTTDTAHIHIMKPLLMDIIVLLLLVVWYTVTSVTCIRGCVWLQGLLMLQYVETRQLEIFCDFILYTIIYCTVSVVTLAYLLYWFCRASSF